MTASKLPKIVFHIIIPTPFSADFIKNLRGIDEGMDMDDKLLTGIYKRIKADEFKGGTDHVTQVCAFFTFWKLITYEI